MNGEIKGVFLDLDNTLLDFSLSEREAITKTLMALGIDASNETVALYSKINDEQWKLLEKGKLTREQVVSRRFALLFSRLKVNIKDTSQTQAMYEYNLSRSCHVMDGAFEMLAELKKRGYRLFLATNGTLAVQKSRIASSGLRDFFDDVFVSQNLGVNKPSREFFEKAFEICGLCACNTVMVGDSLTSDIAGGINAGMKTVFFNRYPEKTTKMPVIPTVSVTTLGEIPDAIDMISSMQRKD